MSKYVASIAYHRKCVFCENWRGNAAVPHPPLKNEWQFETDDRAFCPEKSISVQALSNGCSCFKLDEKKYPLE